MANINILCVFSRSKKDKSKGVMKPDSSDPEPEGLTLLVPDIQKTAEIVYAATTSLRQANQGRRSHCSTIGRSFMSDCLFIKDGNITATKRPLCLDCPALGK